MLECGTHFVHDIDFGSRMTPIPPIKYKAEYYVLG